MDAPTRTPRAEPSPIEPVWRVLTSTPLAYSLDVRNTRRAQVHFSLKLERPLAERRVVCTFEVFDAEGTDITLPNLTKSQTLGKQYVYLPPGLDSLDVHSMTYDLPPRATTLRVGLVEWAAGPPIEAPSFFPVVLEPDQYSTAGPFVGLQFLVLSR